MTQETSLSGQTVVITGGSRGIGAAIATKLAEMGASTAIIGRNRAALDSVARQITVQGSKCVGYVCNLEDHAEVERVAQEIDARPGAPEILVNCAGVGLQGKTLLECSAILHQRDRPAPRTEALRLNGLFVDQIEGRPDGGLRFGTPQRRFSDRIRPDPVPLCLGTCDTGRRNSTKQ